MINFKINIILGLVGVSINLLLLFESLYRYYLYNFTNLLFLFMYPNWILLVNSLLAIVGIYMSILLIRNNIGLKFFLITTLLLWLVVFSNYFLLPVIY